MGLDIYPGYFPPLEEYKKWWNAGKPDASSTRFIKQTWRSRCQLAGPNGLLMLSIPLGAGKTTMTYGDVMISYAEDWQRQHLRTLRTCLGSAPYWLYLSDDLEELYTSSHGNLYTFVSACMDLSSRWLGDAGYIQEPYQQVFMDRFGFIKGLSVLDCMAHVGPNKQ